MLCRIIKITQNYIEIGSKEDVFFIPVKSMPLVYKRGQTENLIFRLDKVPINQTEKGVWTAKLTADAYLDGNRITVRRKVPAYEEWAYYAKYLKII